MITKTTRKIHNNKFVLDKAMNRYAVQKYVPMTMPRVVDPNYIYIMEVFPWLG